MVKSSKFSLKHTLFAVLFLLSVILSGIMTATSAQATNYPNEIDTNGVYIITSKLSGKAIEPLYNATAKGTKLVQSTVDYADTQKWYITEAGAGYYYITNFSSGNVIDINGASTSNGANAILYTNKGGYNQQWKIIATGDGYYNLVSRKSGKYLDVYGKSYNDNAEIIQYTSNGGSNQQWFLTKIGTTSNASDMRDISSFDFVADMGYGWNLGNTLDSRADWLIGYGSVSYFETAWGNPITTKAMIDTVKSAGFSTVRIPVTWYGHIDSNYNIDSAWLDRVQTVVDYVIDNDMYAILNIHHEDAWVIMSYSSMDVTKSQLKSVWTQIANRFKDYDDKLIFETLNEPRNVGESTEWTGGTEESRSLVNIYNQTALDAIRATGGNNAVRFVMVPTHSASSCYNAINGFVLPTDSATDRLIVSQHLYTPYDFALNESGTSYWGSDSDKAALESEFNMVYNKFCANGIPVVVGEFNALYKNNDLYRADWAEYFVSYAKSKGMACVVWDNGATDMGLLNRSGLYWDHYDVVKAIANGYNNGYSNSSSSSSGSSSASGTKTLYSGWCESGDHANSIKIDASAFSGLSSSQISNATLKITYSGGNIATWGVGIQVYTQNANVELYPWTAAAYSGTAEISTDSNWSYALTNGIEIKGYNWIITNVELVY